MSNSWQFSQALESLGVRRETFDPSLAEVADGAHGVDWVAVSPSADYRRYVYLRELAHTIMGHDAQPGAREEAEAESVAFILARILGLRDEQDWSPAAAQLRIEINLSLLGLDDLDDADYVRVDIAVCNIMNAGVRASVSA